MKLHLCLAVIDVLILLAYPIAFLAHRVRRLTGLKK